MFSRSRQILGGLTLLTLALAPAAAHAQGLIGNFSASRAKDALTDEDRSNIYTVGETKTASLAWSCAGDQFRVMVMVLAPQYLIGTTDNIFRVQYRFPPRDAVLSDWIRVNHKVAVLLQEPELRTFTDDALAYGKVTIRVYGTNNENVTDTFDLTGLQAALQTLPCRR